MATHISPTQIMPGRLPAAPVTQPVAAVAALPRPIRPASISDIVPSPLPLKARVQGQASAQDVKASALALRATAEGQAADKTTKD